MGQLSSEAVRTRAGNSQNQQSQLLGQTGIIDKCIERSTLIVNYLETNLRKDVYSEEDLKMIKHIKVVLDLKGLMAKVTVRGPAQVAQVSSGKFLESCEYIDCEYEEKCEEIELRIQYRRFLEQLQDISNLEDSEKFTSMQIFILLLNTKEKRWQNIEGIMDILVRAALMKSVEAVVESWVSVLEHHSSKTRGLGDDAVKTEMMISINGPEIQHCDPIVAEAMNNYWKNSVMKGNRDGHFVRRSQNIKDWLVSSSVDRLNNRPKLVPFM